MRWSGASSTRQVTSFAARAPFSRDLGVLAAALHRWALGRGIRVLDAICGWGVRTLSYHSRRRPFVWANDAFDGCRGLILSNLSGEVRVSPEGEWRWVVMHWNASKELVECHLQWNFFDLVDIDSLGSESLFMRLAIAAVKVGGLLYITSTTNHQCCLLRRSCFRLSFIAAFSYYAYHGPIFKVVLEVAR